MMKATCNKNIIRPELGNLMLLVEGGAHARSIVLHESLTHRGAPLAPTGHAAVHAACAHCELQLDGKLVRCIKPATRVLGLEGR
jgi:hypothetical protein